MTEETTNTTETPETPELDETAFIIIRREDGAFYATTDLSQVFKVKRPANRQDVKHGCQDILDVINHADVANASAELILRQLMPKPEETVSGSIREALDERGIL